MFFSLHSYKVKIVRDDSVPCYGAEVRCSGEGTDDTRADEDREVETVLGVPVGSYRSLSASEADDGRKERGRTPSHSSNL